jgi:hypothetical protein
VVERDRARSGGVEGVVWVLEEEEKEDRGCGERRKKEGEEEEEIKREMGV